MGKYEKAVEELEELEQKLREQEARRNSGKREKVRLQIERTLEAKTVETEGDAGKLNITLAKLVIAKFQGMHLDWQRFWGHLQAEIEKGSHAPKVDQLIVATVSVSSKETVQTKWRPCQDEIMTTTEAAVEN